MLHGVNRWRQLLIVPCLFGLEYCFSGVLMSQECLSWKLCAWASRQPLLCLRRPICCWQTFTTFINGQCAIIPSCSTQQMIENNSQRWWVWWEEPPAALVLGFLNPSDFVSIFSLFAHLFYHDHRDTVRGVVPPLTHDSIRFLKVYYME